MTGELVTETLQLGTALNSEFQQTAAAALSVTFGNTSQRSQAPAAVNENSNNPGAVEEEGNAIEEEAVAYEEAEGEAAVRRD